jgi:antitoxin HicB
MNPAAYSFEIRPLPEEDGGGYLIVFPDLPGCMADGETPEDALHNGMDAALSWLKTAAEFNDPIPQPNDSNSGKFMTRVPKSLHMRLATRARQEGVSMNALVVTYLAEGLSRHELH